MGSTKYEVERFTGQNDFGLWRLKMRALLVQQGLVEALNEEKGMPESLTTAEKKTILEKAHSAMILSLGDKVLRQVSREKSAAAIWNKLESLYMTKSLVNRLYLKQKLYSFKMYEDKAIGEQLDEFNKLILNLENIEVEIDDEDQALLLLSALPKSFMNFKETMLYGRESVSLEEVMAALNSRELNGKVGYEKHSVKSESLNIRPKQERKEFKNKNQGKEKQKPKLECWVCHKEGHLRRNCPER